MAALGFDSFTKKIFISAPLPKLYWCWGTEEGITSWFLRKASYTSIAGEKRQAGAPIQKGDQYIWEWHNWDGQEKGTILKANGIDFIEFSFAGECKVAVSLETFKESVLVSLRQYQIPTDDEHKLSIHYGCSNGWTFWLANLKAYLEYGIQLNETARDLRNTPLAGFEFVNM